MSPARFRWGMLLVLLGVVLLLRNLDVVNSNFWADFVMYFPVLLIAIGLEKIFTKTKAHYVAYATSVLIFVGGIWVVMAGSRGGLDDSFFSETQYEIPDEGAIQTLRATVDLGEGNLTVRDASEKIFDGQFRQFTVKPEIVYTVEGSEGVLSLAGRAKRWLGGVVRVETDETNDWFVSFSNKIPLSLECLGEESDIHLNLASTPVKKIRVDVSDGAIYLKLGTIEPEVDVTVGGENSELRLRVPEAVGLKITGVEDAEYLTRVGLVRRNGFYISEGFDTLSSHIKVDVDDQLSSLNIDYY